VPDEGSSEKVGGINKNWWYVIGAGIGLLGYLYYRSRQSASAATTADNATGSSTGSGGATDYTTSLASPTATSTISTLADWLNSAQSWAVSTLGSDPATVQNALQAYSNGNCLTTQEFQIIDQALGALGAPPDAPYQGVVLCPNQGSTGGSTGGTTTTGSTTPSSPPPAAPAAGPQSNNPLFLAIGNAAQNADGWFHVPTPSVLNTLKSIGVPVEANGNAVYFNPDYVKNVATPNDIAGLQKQGFSIVNINNHLYYNPKQKVTTKT
jgi:hypothetical protein